VGSSGGRRSKTRTVIRTAKTASENALNRSGVAARSTAVSSTHLAAEALNDCQRRSSAVQRLCCTAVRVSLKGPIA
jgi:hypothetical protein